MHGFPVVEHAVSPDGCKSMYQYYKSQSSGKNIQVTFSSAVSEALGIFSNSDLHFPSVRQTRALSIGCVLITLNNSSTFQYMMCMYHFKYVHMSASTCGGWAADPQQRHTNICEPLVIGAMNRFLVQEQCILLTTEPSVQDLDHC